MVSPISGISSSSATQQLRQTSTVEETPVVKATTTSPKAATDSVHVSAGAQARLLKQQGQSVAQIANNMGLDKKTVSSLLGDTTTASVGGQIYSSAAQLANQGTAAQTKAAATSTVITTNAASKE